MSCSANTGGRYSTGNGKQLEDSEPRSSNRPLTPFRVLRGVVCLVIWLSTAFILLLFLAPVTCLFLRLSSIHYSRKTTSFFFGLWLSMWPFLFEKINKTKVIFSGENIPIEERVLLFANHRTEVDWMYLWDLAIRKGQLGYIKYIMKSSLMKLPIFGWGFRVFEFISVERKWEMDEPTMRKKLATFTDPNDSLWLAVFPEGTDYTDQKCLRSQKFAAENGLPILKYALLPKTKGFIACLGSLRHTLNAVYDVTIAYKQRCPSLIDNVFGLDPSEVHIHVQRFNVHEIPELEAEAAAWLTERFRLKDQLLSDFAASGHFPNQGTEGEISTFVCLVKFLAVITLTCISTYLTLFSSVWYKVYVALSFICLTAATYFDVLPSPILDSIKSLFLSKKNL